MHWRDITPNYQVYWFKNNENVPQLLPGSHVHMRHTYSPMSNWDNWVMLANDKSNHKTRSFDWFSVCFELTIAACPDHTACFSMLHHIKSASPIYFWKSQRWDECASILLLLLLHGPRQETHPSLCKRKHIISKWFAVGDRSAFPVGTAERCTLTVWAELD